MKSLLRRTALLVTILVLPLASSRAETIEWGFDAPFTDSVDSFGTTLDASYVFHLGDFQQLTDTFTPDRNNIDQWSANWRPFVDSATNATTAYNTGTDTFFSSNSIPDNTVYEVGDQAYIWGTNNGISDSGEFILLTSAAWQYPSATPTGTAISNFKLTRGGPDTGVSAIVGAIDSTYSGSETGISFDASGGDGFDLQTEAIPEPAGALFFSVSATWFLFRRPRRATE